MSKNEALDELYRSWTAATESYSIRWPATFSCPEGCCECCRTTPSVPIEALEAERISEAILRFPERKKTAIVDRIRAMVKTIERGSGSRACPLLDGNKCLVYEDRPLFCRAYGFAAEEDGVYFGCEVLLPELRLMARVELPSLSAAKDRMPKGEVLDKHGKALPALGPLAEMLIRLLDD